MLYRTLRPKCWDDLIGHQQLKVTVQRLMRNGNIGGRAFALVGPSGVGKSAAAAIIAHDVCDPDNVIELDASGITPAAIVDLERSLRCYCIGEKSGRAIVINECHGLRSDTIRQLLVTLERIPKHVVWIFTTMTNGQQTLFGGTTDQDALLSRCLQFQLRPEKTLWCEYVQRVAADQGLDGAPPSTYHRHYTKVGGNLRAMLTAVEAGEFLRAEPALAS